MGKKNNDKSNNPIIFLNVPIESSKNDIIGLNAYADSLSAAIDNGAQTIAVTSSFGMGKTSVIELLKEKRSDRKQEFFLKIPMWTQLSDKEINGVIDLHRHFIYQIASQINANRGIYVNRRLSPNYRLIKLHTNKKSFWLLILLSAIFTLFSWLLKNLPALCVLYLPLLKDKTDQASIIALFAAIVLFIIPVLCSEIIVSTGQSETPRNIEADEIIELYCSEILKHRRIWPQFLKKVPLVKVICKWFTRKYVVIIEDLDRSSRSDAVKDFLKQLRKYYVPEGEDIELQYKNRVTFIVNIKPEAEVDREGNFNCDGKLYDKIFDYILNIQTIHFDDYNTILKGLLREKKQEIMAAGLLSDEDLSAIRGMQWIIREPNVGIREIKERLNRAFSLFDSLKKRFPNGNILFEKCAVVAYITTAFEDEFLKTDDSAYQKAIDLYLKTPEKDDQENREYEKILSINKKETAGKSSLYAETIIELIKNGIIDTNYRMYFYNYPKNSRIYTNEESITLNALLYDKEYSEQLAENVLKVESDGSSVIDEGLKRRRQLGLPLPRIVFQNENLYKTVLKQDVAGVIQWMKNRNYNAEATEKTLLEISRILKFDNERSVYNETIADQYAGVWEQSFSEDQLLRLRSILCTDYPDEILWYKRLFFGVHALISSYEIQSISAGAAIKLVDVEDESISESIINLLLKRYEEDLKHQEYYDDYVAVLREVSEQLYVEEITPLLFQFMLYNKRIDGMLEDIIIETIMDDSLQDDFREKVERAYKNLVISVEPSNYSENTLEHIIVSEDYVGYNLMVAKELEKKGYYYATALIMLYANVDFDICQKEIIEAIAEKKEELVEDNKKADLDIIRNKVLNTSQKAMKEYSFLFSKDFPILTEEEFHEATSRTENVIFISSLIPPELVTDKEAYMLGKYFSKVFRQNNTSIKILEYIASLKPDIAVKCFKSLNFDNIRYNSFSTAKKDRVKQIYTPILELDSAPGIIEFMRLTKCVDSDWDKRLLPILSSDNNLAKRYIDVVNHAKEKSITNTTIKNICSIESYYPLVPIVTNKIYRNKYYKTYIVSKMLYEKRFIMETNEKFETLWPEYVKLFKEEKNTEVKRYMNNNEEFLEKLLDFKEYIDMNKDLRLVLAKVLQDEESIRNVMEYGVDYALEYYSVLKGFKDEIAATAFIEIVEGSKVLLRSNEVYNNTYEKLISSSLKARYTRKRNRALA